MNASQEFCNRMLSRLRSMVRMPKDMAGVDLEMQQTDYVRVLAKYPPEDVEAGVLRYAEQHKFWPTLSELLEAIGQARESRQITGPATANPLAELSQAVNVAFGFLSNAHLRELDRLDPHRRQQIVNETARWFLPYWREAIGAQGQPAMRPWIAMINEFIEAKLGKSWRQILDEERAARGPDLAPVPGFKTLDAALEKGLAQTAEPVAAE